MGGVVGREVATYVSTLARSHSDSRLMSLCT